MNWPGNLLLGEHFHEWRQGRISAGELSHLVHQYHNGPARDLWKCYNNGLVHMQVASAIVRGILREEDIPKEIWPYIQGALEFCGYGPQEAPESSAEDV
jgi:hypothetical protein